jgi:hypothetical protein
MFLIIKKKGENHPTLIYTLSLPQVPSCKKGEPLKTHFNFPQSAWNISHSQKEIQFLE